jgi:hypothetical protein
MNLKEELSKTIYSNHDKVPFDDTAELCEQICLRYAIEVVEDIKERMPSYESCTCEITTDNIYNKIKELKAKIKSE